MAGERILVVDDDELVRSMLNRFLEDYSVDTAKDGKDALEQINDLIAMV